MYRKKIEDNNICHKPDVSLHYKMYIFCYIFIRYPINPIVRTTIKPFRKILVKT